MKKCLAVILLLYATHCLSQQPAVNQWTDAFPGSSIDAAKWEKFVFEGPGGCKVNVADGVLQLKGLAGSRCGVRSVPEFSGDRWIVEAKLPHRPGAADMPFGFAALTVMFDTSGRNRIEWVWRTDGRFEAWKVIDGRSEQLDSHNLATKEASPTIAIVRKGNTIMFVLNGEVGLEKQLKEKLPNNFHVMLYGFGTSEDDWQNVRIVTTK
jgi:hypothetical protein